ncbi:hypothetical protein SAMN05421810_11446 [Amycolatopsis arida]|uniref:Uncharacterized protein n=1 Tax=Amycolatopsis arida TaxID=587909 RepID=A0A1I6ARS9_9PSEU|nr:hypothetical protein [Amycolatopsis arida]TDX97577.1 hypothetical protein CLV69_102681 [Amycolatopsis arida]SFQ71394.1 hypothetical protein SAMN05421810_11446 [Amycolatopsis arida]
MTTTERVTATRDEHFNLTSVLYHTLQEAETVERYIEDARRAGDDEAVRFFEEIQESDRQRAERAKRLLAGRLAGGGRS